MSLFEKIAVDEGGAHVSESKDDVDQSASDVAMKRARLAAYAFSSPIETAEFRGSLPAPTGGRTYPDGSLPGVSTDSGSTIRQPSQMYQLGPLGSSTQTEPIFPKPGCPRLMPDSILPSPMVSRNGWSVSSLLHQQPSRVEVPLLKVEQEASPDYSENVKRDSLAAQVYLRAKDAVVLVQNKEAKIAGTGFFVSTDGKIVTDDHVVEFPGNYTVVTSDGIEHEARIVKKMPIGDLAELKIDPEPGQKFEALPIAYTSNDLRPGEPLFAIGHPKGWPETYESPGEFLRFVKRYDVAANDSENSRQSVVEAAMHIEPGNSGSPVLDRNGKVIGVADYTYTRTPLVVGGMNSVDEIHDLLDDQPDAPWSDYVFPRALHTGTRTDTLALTTGILTWKTIADLRLPPAAKPGVLGSVFGAAVGLDRIPGDYRHLQVALDSGTTAEKVDAGIEVAGDAMLLSGTLGLVNPRLRPSLTAVQMTGATLKLANDLFSDRKY